MLVTDYDALVKRTNKFSNSSKESQEAISIYGLVGEIGSLVSAVKKKQKLHFQTQESPTSNDEIEEELGDIIWYCFALARLANEDRANVFTRDIAALRQEMQEENERAEIIRRTLDTSRRAEFLEQSKQFPNTELMTFGDYQRLAFLTARTHGSVLLEVCLAVLSQLGAELMRRRLPESERKINTSIADRTVNAILGEIAWHLAAISSTYGLSLDKIAEQNSRKVSARFSEQLPTPLHDEQEKQSEKFPRAFDIVFLTVQKGKARMYINGRQLGDELTDNSYENDGYRFHDVMHIANTAILGWSPVLRSLLKIKRKGKEQVDEVEDGARARIVEELIVKAVHSEGQRQNDLKGGPASSGCDRFFESSHDVTFNFLKFIVQLSSGLEVHNNKLWEWERAIVEGHKIYHQLRINGQGTVSVNLNKRSISFNPVVDLQFKGVVSGTGLCSIDMVAADDVEVLGESDRLIRCVRMAVLSALDRPNGLQMIEDIAVTLGPARPTLRLKGAALQLQWESGIVWFQVATSKCGNIFSCVVLALSDP